MTRHYRQRPFLRQTLGQGLETRGIEGQAGGLELRAPHVDTDAAIGVEPQGDYAATGLHAQSFLVRQALVAHKARQAARAIAALRHLAAIGVVDDVLEVDVCGRRRPHAENLVGPDAKVAVRQKAVLGCAQPPALAGVERPGRRESGRPRRQSGGPPKSGTGLRSAPGAAGSRRAPRNHCPRLAFWKSESASPDYRRWNGLRPRAAGLRLAALHLPDILLSWYSATSAPRGLSASGLIPASAASTGLALLLSVSSFGAANRSTCNWPAPARSSNAASVRRAWCRTGGGMPASWGARLPELRLG